MKVLSEPIEFEWDKGNIGKNLAGHKVLDQECEEAFFDSNKEITKDAFHSDKEDRYVLLGKTKQQRLLFVVFTIRNCRVRVISARDINKKESKSYYA